MTTFTNSGETTKSRSWKFMEFVKSPERDGMWSINYYCSEECSEYHFLTMTDEEDKADLILKALQDSNRSEETFVSHVRG